jgi:hypothetical protein
MLGNFLLVLYGDGHFGHPPFQWFSPTNHPPTVEDLHAHCTPRVQWACQVSGQNIELGLFASQIGAGNAVAVSVSGATR